MVRAATSPRGPALRLLDELGCDHRTEKGIDSLFSGPKTTALLDSIGGLDDFKLYAFLAIQQV